MKSIQTLILAAILPFAGSNAFAGEHMEVHNQATTYSGICSQVKKEGVNSQEVRSVEYTITVRGSGHAAIPRDICAVLLPSGAQDVKGK